MGFELKTKVEEKIIVKAIGELDIFATDEFKEKISEIYKENKLDILFDFEKLDYIDSTGLGSLIFIYKEMVKDNKKIELINVKPNIRKLFLITKLDQMFEIRWRHG